MLAPTMLLGDEIEQLGAKCLRPLGIDYDTAGSAVVREARELLLPVAANLTRMSAENEVDRDGMLAYARKWRLDEDLYVQRLVDYLCHPTWLPYESCYPEGLQKCRQFVNGDPGRFLGCSQNSSPQRHSNDKRSPRALPLRSNTGNQRTLSQARAFRAS
jgi:hypothetical protein